jgi:hypothetical protein
MEEHHLMFNLVGKLRSEIDFALELNQEPSLNTSLDLCIRKVLKVLESDRASIWVFDAEKE